MALEEQVMQQPQQPQQPAEGQEAPQQGQPEQLSDEEEKDLKIAVLLTERLMADGGYKVIDDAVKTSKDPSQVIGQFMIQLIKKLDESMPNEAKLSKRIWLCKGGWLEQVMDDLVDEFGLDYSITDKAEVYVADTVKKLAQAGRTNAGAAPQPGAPEQPPMPQQGGV